MRYEVKYQNVNSAVCYDYLDSLEDLGKTYAKALNGRVIVRSVK